MTYVSQLDFCPDCMGTWKYDHDGKRYSHIIAVYDWERDRTVAWRCPHCGAQWDRLAEVDA